MRLAFHNLVNHIYQSIQWAIGLVSDNQYYVNLVFHKQNNTYGDTRKPKTHGWDSDPLPIDIYTPSLYSLPTTDTPKFFFSEIVPEIFMLENLVGNFSSRKLIGEIFGVEIYEDKCVVDWVMVSGGYVPEIFFSQNSLGKSELVSVDYYLGTQISENEVGNISFPIRFYNSGNFPQKER